MFETLFEKLFEKLMQTKEAAIDILDLQKEVKASYKGKSTRLKISTWSSTLEKWYKFWLLTDGTVIPVVSTHRETVENAETLVQHFWEGDARIEFLETGAVAGYINGAELNIQGHKKLSKQQISQLKNLSIEYKIDSIVVDIGTKDWKSDVKSSGHLDYLLNYGLDEAVESEQIEKEQFFLDRTNKHIELVQKAAAKILKAYPEYDVDVLRDQIEKHDASKFEEPEVNAFIEITWRHKLEREKGDFDPIKGKGYQTPGDLVKDDENEATFHHITNNSHHPEYHLQDEDKKELVVDKSDREVVDASLMPPSDIVEMVADWQAMSDELQLNTAKEWFDKQKNVRWNFTEEQEKLIYKLLSVFE